MSSTCTFLDLVQNRCPTRSAISPVAPWGLKIERQFFARGSAKVQLKSGSWKFQNRSTGSGEIRLWSAKTGFRKFTKWQNWLKSRTQGAEIGPRNLNQTCSPRQMGAADLRFSKIRSLVPEIFTFSFCMGFSLRPRERETQPQNRSTQNLIFFSNST